MPRTTALALTAPILLAACVTATPPDPQIAPLAQHIRAQSAGLYAALAQAPTPECDWDHNKNLYAQLSISAAQLRAHIAQTKARKPLIRAADALSQTIADAARSHRLASAITDDLQGPCLAPTAITLNADAISRASAALASTQEGTNQ